MAPPSWWEFEWWENEVFSSASEEIRKFNRGVWADLGAVVFQLENAWGLIQLNPLQCTIKLPNFMLSLPLLYPINIYSTPLIAILISIMTVEHSQWLLRAGVTNNSHLFKIGSTYKSFCTQCKLWVWWTRIEWYWKTKFLVKTVLGEFLLCALEICYTFEIFSYKAWSLRFACFKIQFNTKIRTFY